MNTAGYDLLREAYRAGRAEGNRMHPQTQIELAKVHNDDLYRKAEGRADKPITRREPRIGVLRIVTRMGAALQGSETAERQLRDRPEIV